MDWRGWAACALWAVACGPGADGVDGPGESGDGGEASTTTSSASATDAADTSTVTAVTQTTAASEDTSGAPETGGSPETDAEEATTHEGQSESSASSDESPESDESSGAATDAGSDDDSFGESGGEPIEISGVVVAATAPSGDGIGTLYVALSVSIDCFDGDSSAVDVIANADLSEIGNEVPFSIVVSSVEWEGSDAILQVFLDDDENAVAQDPDPGDMTVFPNGFEEVAGCPELGTLEGDVTDLVVELDHIVR
jgi:hypothetical protein